MTTFDRIEGRLPELLDELADARLPDYFDHLVLRTATARQRPAWAFPERWLPMTAVLTRAPGRNLPWRTLGVVALLMLLIAAAALALVGTRQSVPPFGLARPGLVAFEEDGDIHTVDPRTGTRTPLVTGSSVDSRPTWSLDGTRVAFRREVGDGLSDVYVVSVPGGVVTRVTTAPALLVAQHLFSPDGSALLVASRSDGATRWALLGLDGGQSRALDLPGGAASPAFRPVDGREIVFVVGGAGSAEGQGLVVYELASDTMRELVRPSPGSEIVGRPRYSPDGSRLAYSSWVPDGGVNAFVYTVPADGGEPDMVRFPADVCCEGAPAWSNRGDRLALTRWYLNGRRVVTVVPVGGSVERQVEFELPDIDTAAVTWSADDRWLLATPRYEGGRTGTELLVLDLATGEIRKTGWPAATDPEVQRLAP